MKKLHGMQKRRHGLRGQIRAAASVREDRDKRLAECDWMANSDVTMASAWTTYRQGLRDVPAQSGFPNSVTWPTKPT